MFIGACLVWKFRMNWIELFWRFFTYDVNGKQEHNYVVHTGLKHILGLISRKTYLVFILSAYILRAEKLILKTTKLVYKGMVRNLYLWCDFNRVINNNNLFLRVQFLWEISYCILFALNVIGVALTE